jgi:RimJ/RimL family protein N-acetyltransferase
MLSTRYSDNMNLSPVSLTTARLIIREYCKNDFAGVHEYARDPETVKFMNWGPNTPKETRKFIELAVSQQEVEPRENYHLVIALQDTQRIIGGCGIHCRNSTFDQAEVGYCFNKKYWGQGFATESLGALLKFGFEILGAKRIKATCDTRNLASARVMEKNGMLQMKYIKKHLHQKGEWRDSFGYAILGSEWQDWINKT